ncbi:MAG: response regulator [Nannocystaceae bacterium]|jgi:CheY-like chemotaxis protein
MSPLDPAAAVSDNAVVLVVDDEPVLRASMVRGLARLPHVEVVDAGSLREAIELIDAVQPRLVISDLDLQDGTGLDVLDALDKRGMHPPVLFVSAYTLRFSGRVPVRRDVTVREKPVPLEVLRADVVARLGVDVESEEPFSTTDYIQLACMGNRSVAIELQRDGVTVGSITVRAGELWSAHDRRGSGTDALQRLLHDPALRPRCGGVRASMGPRDITGSWQAVLLEAARLHDERMHASRRTEPRAGEGVDAAWDDLLEGGEAPAPPPVSPAITAAFDASYERGVDALLRKDYLAAQLAFTDAARIAPEDPRVRANLLRLAQLGFGGGT